MENIEATTSKVFMLPKENMEGTNHTDCVDNENSLTGTLNKVLLAASGKINYAPKTSQEKELVEWLQSFEDLVDN